MNSGQPLPSPRQSPQLFQVFPTEALIFTTPLAVYRGLHVRRSVYHGTTGSPSCACQLYLTVWLYLRLFCDYRNCEGKSRFPGLFLISQTFPWPMPNSPTFPGESPPCVMTTIRYRQQPKSGQSLCPTSSQKMNFIEKFSRDQFFHYSRSTLQIYHSYYSSV